MRDPSDTPTPPDGIKSWRYELTDVRMRLDALESHRAPWHVWALAGLFIGILTGIFFEAFAFKVLR